jgi:hypothetical protein
LESLLSFLCFRFCVPSPFPSNQGFSVLIS